MDEMKKLLIAQLREKLESVHDASEHRFEPSRRDASACAKCGWVDIGRQKMSSGRTRREAAEKLLEELESGETEIAAVVEVIEISIPYSRGDIPGDMIFSN